MHFGSYINYAFYWLKDVTCWVQEKLIIDQRVVNNRFTIHSHFLDGSMGHGPKPLIHWPIN